MRWLESGAVELLALERDDARLVIGAAVATA
jgi:hypothetical protein